MVHSVRGVSELLIQSPRLSATDRSIEQSLRSNLGCIQQPGVKEVAAGLTSQVAELAHRVEKLASDFQTNLAPESAAVDRELAAVPFESNQVRARVVEGMIRARRRRTEFFASNLFADPAWDILLDLYLAHLLQRRICTSSLCIAANVPATTALRWIKCMCDDGILLRRPDPLDARRVFIELSLGASRAMINYFNNQPNDLSEAA